MPNLLNEQGWKMHVPELYQRLGLHAKAKLPWQGMNERLLDNVRVWVLSVPDAKERGLFHRVRCACPKCNREMSAGRLHQHQKTCGRPT